MSTDDVVKGDQRENWLRARLSECEAQESLARRARIAAVERAQRAEAELARLHAIRDQYGEPADLAARLSVCEAERDGLDETRLTGGSRSFPVDPGVSGGVGS